MSFLGGYRNDVHQQNDGMVRASLTEVAPFQPHVKRTSVDTYELLFNQAYVYDYLNGDQLKEPILIQNMGSPYETSSDSNVELWVELTLNVDNGAVENAKFIFGGGPESSDDNTLKIATVENPSQSSVTQLIPVGEMKGPTIKTLNLRDNIHWWGRKIEQLGRETSYDIGHPIKDPEIDFNQPLKIRAFKVEVDDSVHDDDKNNSEIFKFNDSGDHVVLKVPRLEVPEIPEFTSGDSVNHPWKVTMTNAGEFNVSGGTVHGNGGPFVVAPKTELIKNGIIWVKITRDSSSREMTAAVIGSDANVPASDYTDQYRPIASVDDAGSPPVLQLQFQELRVEELMIVANGEFELLSVDAAARNTYDPPV